MVVVVVAFDNDAQMVDSVTEGLGGNAIAISGDSNGTLSLISQVAGCGQFLFTRSSSPQR